MRNRINRQQLELLVYFMKENTWMHTTSNKPRNKIMGAWKVLSNRLNRLGPPNRAVLKWRRVWIDYKSTVRRKYHKLEKLETDMGKSFNQYELLTLDIMSLNGGSKFLTTDKDDNDEATEMPTELKEELFEEESTNDYERIDDELPSYLVELSNADDDDRGETQAEIVADDGTKNKDFGTERNHYFELNLYGKKVTGTKYNNTDLKDVCDLLTENYKDMLEIEREKLFIKKAKAAIEKRRIKLDERKLKILGKEIELNKRKFDIEYKMLLENN